MSAEPQECYEPDNAETRERQPAPRAASLSALEEALRRALESASREQVLHRIAAILPADRSGPVGGLRGKVLKVSVSMPEELTEAVRARTGPGGFSRYVTDAVQERMQHDLLGELLAELEAEYGPLDPELVRQASREWPDYEPE